MTTTPKTHVRRIGVPPLGWMVRTSFCWLLVLGYAASASGVPGWWLVGRSSPGCHCAPSLKLSGKCCCSKPVATGSSTRSCCSQKSEPVKTCCATRGAQADDTPPAVASCQCGSNPESVPLVVVLPTILSESLTLPLIFDDARAGAGPHVSLHPQCSPAPESPPPRTA